MMKYSRVERFRLHLCVLGVIMAWLPLMAAATENLISKTTCTFTTEGSSGLQIIGGGFFSVSGDECGPSLLANYMVALNYFFMRLAIVLAVMMITIGGFQWMMALGDSGKISTAKETIRYAVVGLIVALTAQLLFSQIDKSFVSLKSLNIVPSSASNCIGPTTLETCQARAGCYWNFHDSRLNSACAQPEGTRGKYENDCSIGLGQCSQINIGSRKLPECNSAEKQSFQKMVEGRIGSGLPQDKCYVTLGEIECAKAPTDCCAHDAEGFFSGYDNWMYVLSAGAGNCQSCKGPNGEAGYWDAISDKNECEQRAYSQIMEKEF